MYYGVSICLVSFASAMAVVTLNVHFRGLRGAEVPRSVKKIFLSGLARIVFMQFSPSFAMSEKFGGVADRSDTFEQRMRVSGLLEKNISFIRKLLQNCFKCSTTRSDTMITTGCPANNQLFKVSPTKVYCFADSIRWSCLLLKLIFYKFSHSCMHTHGLYTLYTL